MYIQYVGFIWTQITEIKIVAVIRYFARYWMEFLFFLCLHLHIFVHALEDAAYKEHIEVLTLFILVILLIQLKEKTQKLIGILYIIFRAVNWF